jgi:hypothetical protein
VQRRLATPLLPKKRFLREKAAPKPVSSAEVHLCPFKKCAGFDPVAAAPPRQRATEGDFFARRIVPLSAASVRRGHTMRLCIYLTFVHPKDTGPIPPADWATPIAGDEVSK